MKTKNITQDTLMYYMSDQGGVVTEVKVLSHINRNGICDVEVVQKGLLYNVEVGDILKGFNLLYGVIRFIETDFYVTGGYKGRI